MAALTVPEAMAAWAGAAEVEQAARASREAADPLGHWRQPPIPTEVFEAVWDTWEKASGAERRAMYSAAQAYTAAGLGQAAEVFLRLEAQGHLPAAIEALIGALYSAPAVTR